MIVLLDIEPPYNDGVLTTVVSVGNDYGGVDVQTNGHDLNGSAYCGGILGEYPDKKSEEMFLRIKDSVQKIIEEEMGDVCEKV